MRTTASTAARWRPSDHGSLALPNVIAASAAKGARVIVAEPSQARGKIALGLGAEVIIDPTKSNFLESVNETTHGAGATVVIDASGKPAAMASTLDVAGFRARIVIIGISVGGEAPTRLGQIQSKELQVRGIIGSPGVWPETIAFLSRTGVDLSSIVTSTFDISNADKAYDQVLSDKSQIKVHVTNEGS